MNQNQWKQSNETHNDQYLFTMSTTRQILTISLLAKEALFAWAFRKWVSLFKYLQEFKVACQ